MTLNLYWFRHRIAPLAGETHAVVTAYLREGFIVMHHGNVPLCLWYERFPQTAVENVASAQITCRKCANRYRSYRSWLWRKAT